MVFHMGNEHDRPVIGWFQTPVQGAIFIEFQVFKSALRDFEAQDPLKFIDGSGHTRSEVNQNIFLIRPDMLFDDLLGCLVSLRHQ